MRFSPSSLCFHLRKGTSTKPGIATPCAKSQAWSEEDDQTPWDRSRPCGLGLLSKPILPQPHLLEPPLYFVYADVEKTTSFADLFMSYCFPPPRLCHKIYSKCLYQNHSLTDNHQSPTCSRSLPAVSSPQQK